MNVLGIETSCDETSAAVVKDGRVILSNVVVSSLKEHQKYGGIIPEIASRRQLECINPIVEEAFAKAGLSYDDIDAIAVTASPGLIGSLLVGICFAQALSYAFKKPLIEIDHIKAHLYANFLHRLGEKNFVEPTLPAVGLAVSGGHTQLYYMKNPTDLKVLGATRDDAAGEAFDKVARILKLGYPGGPVIDQIAPTGKNEHLRFKVNAFPDSFDFSFSGIKTAVLYHYQNQKNPTPNQISQIAYSFQKGVVGVLVEKSIQACKTHKVKTLLVGGGVAANSELRRQLQEAGRVNQLKVHFPPLELCLDNAAMIAGLGFHLASPRKKNTSPKSVLTKI